MLIPPIIQKVYGNGKNRLTSYFGQKLEIFRRPAASLSAKLKSSSRKGAKLDLSQLFDGAVKKNKLPSSNAGWHH